MKKKHFGESLSSSGPEISVAMAIWLLAAAQVDSYTRNARAPHCTYVSERLWSGFGRELSIGAADCLFREKKYFCLFELQQAERNCSSERKRFSTQRRILHTALWISAPSHHREDHTHVYSLNIESLYFVHH